MPETYYKAVRPDGTDFRTGTVRWLPPQGEPLPEGGLRVTHPTATRVGRTAAEYLSVSTAVTDCTGMCWPCRLARVEAVGEVTTPEPTNLANKRAGVEWTTVEELDPMLALGPQGAEVAAIIDRARRLTADEATRMAAAWDAARTAAWDAACDAARAAARDAARAAARAAACDAAWAAAWAAGWAAGCDAALATLVRDLITPEQYVTLMATWRAGVEAGQ